MRNEQTVWEFNTKRFCVQLRLSPEDMDPANCFQFDEDIEAVRSGAVEWFAACVVITVDGREIADNYLGGCAYAPVSDFWTAHRDTDPMNRNCSVMRAAQGDVSIAHYFPGMVAEAATRARTELASIRGIHLRTS